MASSPSDHSAGPPREDDEGPPAASDVEKREGVATKPPPPPRRQTMEVQVAWLDIRADEPRVEQIVTPAEGVPSAGGSLTPISDSLKSEPRLPSSDEPKYVPPMRPKAKSVHPISDALQDEGSDIASEFPEPPADFQDDEAPTALRKKPPRVPGAMRTLPPMPVALTKPPPPPRRQTTEVKMEWVELVDDDLVEDPASSEKLPKLYDEQEEAEEKKEVTRVESSPVSTQRIEAEKAVALAELQAQDLLEGPPISDGVRAARAHEATETAKRPAVDEARIAAEAAKKERLSQFLQAVSASIPPGAMKVSDLDTSPASEAELDKLREEALAARKREQDARDREILERRRAERVRERMEEEAKQRRRELEREEEERAIAMRTGTQDKGLLDLSGIDDEIDNALDAVLGPNLSYPPPPPPDDDDK